MCTGICAYKAKDYEKLNLHRIKGNTIREEIIFDNPKLLNTPIVRNGKQATVGYCQRRI